MNSFAFFTGLTKKNICTRIARSNAVSLAEINTHTQVAINTMNLSRFVQLTCFLVSYGQAMLRGLTRESLPHFVLIDAENNRAIADIVDGAVIPVLVGARLNVQAASMGIDVDRVQFSYNGVAAFRTESVAPWALCGDVNGEYNSCAELVVGVEHSVTAQAFTGDGTSSLMTVSFSLTPIITDEEYDIQLFLVDIDKGSKIAMIGDGDVIAIPHNSNLNVLAEVSDADKVQFGYNGDDGFQTERVEPYLFCGDEGGKYNTCQELGTGKIHTVTAQAFNGDFMVASVKVNFILEPIDDSPLTPSPSSSPATQSPTLLASNTKEPSTEEPTTSPTGRPIPFPTTSEPTAAATTFSPTVSPTETTSNQPTTTPTSLPTTMAVEVSTNSPTTMATVNLDLPVCKPTSGSCASTATELQDMIDNAASGNEIVAICGDGEVIETTESPIRINAPSMTMCCAGSVCLMRNEGTNINLIVKGDDFSMMDITVAGGKYQGGNDPGGNVDISGSGHHRIVNCVFLEGSGPLGANLRVNNEGGAVSIQDSRFSLGGGGGWGGGAHIDGTDSAVKISGSHFVQNDSGFVGGGLSFLLNGNCSVILGDCVFDSNAASNSGGGVAIFVDDSRNFSSENIAFANNSFANNVAPQCSNAVMQHGAMVCLDSAGKPACPCFEGEPFDPNSVVSFSAFLDSYNSFHSLSVATTQHVYLFGQKGDVHCTVDGGSPIVLTETGLELCKDYLVNATQQLEDEILTELENTGLSEECPSDCLPPDLPLSGLETSCGVGQSSSKQSGSRGSWDSARPPPYTYSRVSVQHNKTEGSLQCKHSLTPEHVSLDPKDYNRCARDLIQGCSGSVRSVFQQLRWF